MGINPLLLCTKHSLGSLNPIPFMLVVSYILANREVLAPYLWRLLNHVLS